MRLYSVRHCVSRAIPRDAVVALMEVEDADNLGPFWTVPLNVQCTVIQPISPFKERPCTCDLVNEQFYMSLLCSREKKKTGFCAVLSSRDS